MEKEFDKIIGVGKFSQNGVSFQGDRATIVRNGVSKEVSREEGAAEIHRVLSGGNKIPLPYHGQGKCSDENS